MDKFKNWCEEHAAGVGTAIVGAATVVLCTVWYGVGYKSGVQRIGRGLNIAIVRKPELKQMLKEACDEAIDILK